MPYYNEGTLTTDIREVAIDTTWDTQTDWEAYQSLSNVVIENGVVVLEEFTQPPSGITRLEFEQDPTDSWGDNDATVNGATYSTTSEVGSYALQFDGTDDYVSVPINLNDYQPLSVSFWLNPDSPTSTVNIHSNDDGSYGRIVRLNSDGTFEVLGSEATAFNSSNGSIPFDSYSHVVVTWSTSSIDLYIDGSLDTSAGGESSTLNDATTVELGRQHGGGGEYPGLIDDPRWYSKELSDSEVSSLYNTGSIQ